MNNFKEKLANQLDQLYFKPLGDNESLESRAEAVDALIKSYNLSWDETLEILHTLTFDVQN